MIRPPYDSIMYADSIGDKEMINKNISRLRKNFKLEK